MDIFQAVKRCLTTGYFDFNGRASRSEYWCFILFIGLFGILFSGLMFVGFGLLNIQSEFAMTYIWLVSGVMVLTVLGLFIPGISVSVRRLHDIGKSGWWLLIGLIPYIGGLILLYWSVKRSQPGENRFGPQPPETIVYMAE